MADLIDQYENETQCIYKERQYSVRDNGAILRHPKNPQKPMQNDNIWTFGKLDTKTGYMVLGGERVHRIVAYAFLDFPPTPEYVIDHIDTNKQNNRVDNLRWITRLENILLNEITRKKIEYLCGMPIEEVLSDISVLHNLILPPNVAWMKTVSKDEAENSLRNWKRWASENKPPIPNYHPKVSRSIYEFHSEVTPIEKMSLYGRAIYPDNAKGADKGHIFGGTYACCPPNVNATLADYYHNLMIGKAIFQPSNKGADESFIADDFFFNEKEQKIAVKCSRESGIKTIFLVTITKEGRYFVHDFKGFFDEDGLEKYYTIAKGEEWTGGEVFDDYC